MLDISTFGEKSDAMHGLIEEAIELVDRSEETHIKDAAIIIGIQYFKHFEIAGYGIICTFANILGFLEIEKLAYQNLIEEKEMDEKLTRLAKEYINNKAVSPIMISSL
jgi:ferritin-like metal-binding protein YciE